MDTVHGRIQREDRQAGSAWPLPDGGIGGSEIPPAATPRSAQAPLRQKGRGQPPSPPPQSAEPIEAEYRRVGEPLLAGWVAAHEWPQLRPLPHGVAGLWLRVVIVVSPLINRYVVELLIYYSVVPVTGQPKSPRQPDDKIDYDDPGELRVSAAVCPSGRARQILESAAAEFERLQGDYHQISLTRSWGNPDLIERKVYDEERLAEEFASMLAFYNRSLDLRGVRFRIDQYQSGQEVGCSTLVAAYAVWLLNEHGERISVVGERDDNPAFFVPAASGNRAMRLVARDFLGVEAHLATGLGVKRLAAQCVAPGDHAVEQAHFLAFFLPAERAAGLAPATLPPPHATEVGIFEQLAEFLTTMQEGVSGLGERMREWWLAQFGNGQSPTLDSFEQQEQDDRATRRTHSTVQEQRRRSA